MRKLLFWLSAVAAVLLAAHWLVQPWVTQQMVYIHGLERTNWARALDVPGWTGVPLRIRCEFNAECAAVMEAYERKYPPQPPKLESLIPVGALMVLAVLALVFRLPTRTPSLYTGGFARFWDYWDMLSGWPTKNHYVLLLAASPWGHLSRNLWSLLKVAPGMRGRREVGHVLVIAPSRSGKSVSLIANLANYRGSVVVLDIKGELHKKTSGLRNTISDVMVLDPTGAGDGYDPFADLGASEEAVSSAARQLMRVDGEKEPAFAERAAAGVAAMMHAAHAEEVPVLRYIGYCLRERSPMEFVELLRDHPSPESRAQLTDFVGFRLATVTEEQLAGDRYFCSCWSMMRARLAPLLTSGVLTMTGRNDFRAADLTKKQLTVYLRFSQADWSSTKSVFSFIMLGLVQGLLRAADQDEVGDLPVLLAIDEGGTAIVPLLPEFLATVAGRGVSVMLYVQSLGQLMDAYGEARAGVVMDNMHHQVYYSTRGPKTAQHVSDISGRISVPDVRQNRRPTLLGAQVESESWGERDRPLITPDESRRLHEEQVYVVSDNRRIIRARRLAYYQHPKINGALERWKEPTPVKSVEVARRACKPLPAPAVQQVRPAPALPTAPQPPPKAQRAPALPAPVAPTEVPEQKPRRRTPPAGYVDLD